MEYAYRTNQDAPFGWVLVLQAALRRRPAERREPLRLPAPASHPAPDPAR